MTRRLTISNLAHGDRDHRGHHLQLAVRQNSNNGGGDHGSADDVCAATADLSCALATRQGEHADFPALRSPVAVVDVGERSRDASVEPGGAANGNVARLGAD